MKDFQFRITSGVPMPKKAAKLKGELRLAIEALQVGDSFKICDRKYYQQVYNLSKVLGIKIAVRNIGEKNTWRVWRIK